MTKWFYVTSAPPRTLDEVSEKYRMDMHMAAPQVTHGKGITIYTHINQPGLNRVEWEIPGKPRKSIEVHSYHWTYRVVDLLKKKRPMRVVRAFASMMPGYPLSEEHNRVLLDMWKDSPCLYMGVPNKQAMRLLVGLRKHIPQSWIKMKGGHQAYPDRSIADLAEANLIERTEKGGFMTSPCGLDVLRHWATTRSSFEPYLLAYMPKDWEINYKARKVFEAMDGGKP